MRTSDAASKVVSAGEILFSLVLFSVIYLALASLWLYLLRKEILHGPEAEIEPTAQPQTLTPLATPQLA